jgi:clan AA aspartic protease
LDLSLKYSARYLPSAPVIRLEMERVPIECLVDTGFSGGLLIPFSLFDSLGLLSRLSPHSYNAVMPDSRRFLLYTSRGEVSLDGIRTSTEVHASPALDKKLVGRTLLRSFVTRLDGRKEELSLST